MRIWNSLLFILFYLVSIYCFAPLFIHHIADFLCPILLFTLSFALYPTAVDASPPPPIPPSFSFFSVPQLLCLQDLTPPSCFTTSRC